MNFFSGTVGDGGIVVPGIGGVTVATELKLSEGEGVIVGLRPNHLTIDPKGSSHVVELTESLGGVSYVYLNAENGDRLIVEAREDQPMPTGANVGLKFNPAQMYVFDAETEARIR